MDGKRRGKKLNRPNERREKRKIEKKSKEKYEEVQVDRGKIKDGKERRMKGEIKIEKYSMLEGRR